MSRRCFVTIRSVHALALCAFLALCPSVSVLGAQGGRGGGGRGGRGASGGGSETQRDTTHGFAINDENVVAQCKKCHARDSTGIMTRISYLRKTPEGWETSIRRMVTLNGVKLEPVVARAILRYLSNQQGLAPAEVRPGRFEAERRMIEYRYTADVPTERVCRACHSMGRVITERRTRDEWELLVATHRGLYPDADFQAFRRGGPAPLDSAGAGQPMDAAISHLARTFPLRTPEWMAWSASMRPAHLEGTWLLSGYEAGRGAFYGRVTVAKTPGADDEFTTRASYHYARDGKVVTREGKSIVYTGFQWRGRSSEAGAKPDDSWREVMFVEPGWQEMSGRWFKGGYDEFGMDVTLTRLGANTMLAGVSQRGLRTASRDLELTIFGANLPRGIQAGALEFGPGIRVDRVVRATPDSITVRVSVDSAATVGSRDLFVAGASLRAGIVVFDKISRIKVTPLAGMARVGGVNFPKQFQQFEAIAYHNGPDGKPDTADDIEIGPVDAAWSLEEYGVTYDDDDLKFVGSVDTHGLFTPNIDGPNLKRSGNRNNVGDVWVVATYQPAEKGARPLKARAQLVVTVPLYVRWNPSTNPQ
jgi:quinohemoprotein amine dehydrogenase